MTGFGELVPTLAKLMGDYNAVKKGKVSQRVGRREAGKATGKAMRSRGFSNGGFIGPTATLPRRVLNRIVRLWIRPGATTPRVPHHHG